MPTNHRHEFAAVHHGHNLNLNGPSDAIESLTDDLAGLCGGCGRTENI